MEQRFIELLKETLEINDREINVSDKFREYNEWDSIAALNVIAMIDEEYDFVLEVNRFKELQTVGDLISEIKKHI